MHTVINKGMILFVPNEKMEILWSDLQNLPIHTNKDLCKKVNIIHVS